MSWEAMLTQCDWKSSHLLQTKTVFEDKPFLEIIRAVEINKVDLIVVGSHGTTGLKQMLIGSTTEKLVRKAPCPVLIVRAPDFTSPMLF